MMHLRSSHLLKFYILISLVLCSEAFATDIRVGYEHIGVSVDNDVVTTTIHQVLVNDLESPVEVVFRHRLPNDAVVTQFGEWRWGEFVAAALKESSSADAEYESASASGRSASLGEVGRGNLFQMKLFGIPALGTRRVKLSYTYTLTGLASERSLVVPMANEVDSPPTATDVSIVLRDNRPIHSVRTSGQPKMRIKSSHKVTRAEFSHVNSERHRDIVLHWKRIFAPLDLDLAVHTEHVDDASFFLARFAFDRDPAPLDAPTRRVVILVDRSLSMAGEPLESSRRTVERVLDGLSPSDEISVLVFNDDVAPIFQMPRVADDDTKALIRKVIENVRASGRSDINGALRAAVPHLVNAEDAVLLMLTDGQPTYRKDGEDPFSFDTDIAVFNSIRVVAAQFNYPIRQSGLQSMFPNISVRYVPNGPSGHARVNELVALTIAPTIMDLSIEFEGAFPEMVHGSVPDRLPVGESVRIVGRYHEATTVRVKGLLHGQPIDVEGELPQRSVTAPRLTQYVALEWARMRIAELEWDRQQASVISRRRTSIETEIKYLGQRFGLATSQTSFVLTDRLTPSRIKPGDPELRIRAPRSAERVFGLLPWGEYVECVWDEEESIWLGRFLAPRGTADGVYRVRVFVEMQGMVEYRSTLYFRVDSVLPPFELVVLNPGRPRAGQCLDVRARPILSFSRDRADELHAEPIDVKRVEVRSGSTTTALRLSDDGLSWMGTVQLQSRSGRQTLDLVATDYARNSQHAKLVIEVDP